jgi:hypothetical protein
MTAEGGRGPIHGRDCVLPPDWRADHPACTCGVAARVNALGAALHKAGAVRVGQPTHVGGEGYAAVPIEEGITHDPHCCAARGCHRVCSHLCGTDLATHGCCKPAAQPSESEREGARCRRDCACGYAPAAPPPGPGQDGRHLPTHAVMWLVVNERICRKQHAPTEPHEWERATFSPAPEGE